MVVEINIIDQTVRIQTRPDILSGLIWFQTVCKSYQHKTVADKIIIIPLKYNFIYFTNMPSVIPLNPKLNSLIKMERKMLLEERKKMFFNC